MSVLCFGGTTALRLADLCCELWLASLDFSVVYVGGNDLSNGRSPLDVCRDIKVRWFRLMPVFDVKIA